MTIPDEKLKRFLHVIYNTWFNKWKRKINHMTDEDWRTCVEECLRIVEQGNDYDLVMAIGKAFLWELEERSKKNS